MKFDYETVSAVIEKNQAAYINDLLKGIAQPSLAGTGEGIQAMSAIVAEKLRSLGFDVEIIPTEHNCPAIFAERKGASDRSILFYNHYDVQPADPLTEWVSGPFEPEIRNDTIYGRGAMDDKGHLYCRIAAVEAMLEAWGELPCTIRFIVEGEEEIGSPDLKTVVEQWKDRLHSDLCLWEFGDVDDDGYSISYLGYRGMLNVQWNLRTAKCDGHSGVWGGIQVNAIWRLIEALSSLKDADGRVRIPGFYDGTSLPTDVDMAYLAELPPMKGRYLELLESRSLITGEADGPELIVKSVMEPTCNICGISGGYEGEGAKTIVPCMASAKTDFRLVKGQHPEDIFRKLRAYLDSEGYDDIELSILGMLEGTQTPSDHPYVDLVSRTAVPVYGHPQRVYPMCGGSGPAFLFTDIVKTPVFTAGIGNPNSAIHSPNENVRVVDFINGIKHTANICAELGRN